MSVSSWFHHLCLGSAAVLTLALTSCNSSTKKDGAVPKVTTIPAQTTTGGTNFSLDLSKWVKDPEKRTLVYTVNEGGGVVTGGKTYSHTFETLGSKTVKINASNGFRSVDFTFDIEVQTSEEAAIKAGTSLILMNRATVVRSNFEKNAYGPFFITVSNAQGATDTFKAGLKKGHLVFERKQGNASDSQVDLYVFDVYRRRMTQLGSDPQKSTDEKFEVKTADNRVVFTSGSSTDTNLYIWNALTELTREISAVVGEHERNAKVDSNDIVYFERGPSAQRDIYLYDPDEDELDPISTDAKNEVIQDVVTGGGVVFSRDEGSGDIDLYFYKAGVGLAQVGGDVSTTGFQASTLVYNGSTSDGKVVFTRNVSGTDTDLYYWDPDTLTTTVVAANAGVKDVYNGVTTNKKIIYTHEVSGADWDVHAYTVGDGDVNLSGASALKDTFQTITALNDVVMFRGANDMHVWDDSANSLLTADTGGGAALTFVQALGSGNVLYTQTGVGLRRWETANAAVTVSATGSFAGLMHTNTDFVVKTTVSGQDELFVWLEASDTLRIVSTNTADEKYVTSTTTGNGLVFSRKGTSTYDLYVWDPTNGVRRITTTELDHTLAGTYSVDAR